ncbi:MAG: hydroxymethylbilane synthase [Chloroflexota bacterium]|nr:hydroxymethylbilane synthase [Chloroflexota bacterium]
MTTVAALRLGTRGSRLALAQARMAAEAIGAVGFGNPVELVEIHTRGDSISARRPGGRWEETDGQFTTELERALLRGEVDLVVHSLKDLPTVSLAGLFIAAILERADPCDCLLTRGSGGLDGLPFGAQVGTSSPRRAAQLATARPDLLARPIRGNVETRLRRLNAGEFDAVVVAAAGLDRLQIEVPHEARLSLDLMLPAPAQGALALQIRAGDTEFGERVAKADHRPTRIAVEAERALLRRVGGGCLAPLGALGEVTHETLRLRAAYEDRLGGFVRADVSGAVDRPAAVVEAAARVILDAVPS